MAVRSILPSAHHVTAGCGCGVYPMLYDWKATCVGCTAGIISVSTPMEGLEPRPYVFWECMP